MVPLQLIVPTPEAFEDCRTLLDVEVLRERVESLALAAPRQAAEEMVAELARLNRHPAETNHLEELADLYWAAFQALRAHCCEALLGEARVSKKGLALHAAMRQFSVELGFVYKRVILRRWDAIQARGRGKIGCSPLLRALESLSFQLLVIYERHERDAPLLWKEIFQIYRLAEEEGVLDQCPRTSRDETSDKATVSMRLAQILLIRLLDPWRLGVGDLWAANRFLDRAAALAVIAPCGSPGLVGPRFLFTLGQGSLPRMLRNLTEEECSSDSRCLMTARLNRHVSDELARLAGDDQGLKAGKRRRLLKLMRQAWTELPERRISRQPSRGWVQVAWGMEAVSYFLAEERSEETLELVPNDVELTVAQGLGRTPERTFVLQRWRRIDESPAGLRFEVAGVSGECPRAGDLLLLNEGDRVRLACICWMQQHGGHAMRVGASLLEGDFRAVRVKPVLPTGGMTASLPALLARRPKQHQGGFGLLIEQGAYRDADEFLVEEGERLYRIAVRQLLDRTATFDYLEAVLV